jgi:hypothetical protein
MRSFAALRTTDPTECASHRSWANVQRIEAEINATDGDPDEALEKRFSEAEERLWVGSRNAFNARVGRLAPFSALRLHAETPLTDPKRTGVPDGSGSLSSPYNKISLRW